MAENSILSVSAYGISSTGKALNLDNMYLNGRYVNVPSETTSKFSKTASGNFLVYGVSDSDIGVGENRPLGRITGDIVMDMLQYTQRTLDTGARLEKAPLWEAMVEANRQVKEVRHQEGLDILGTSFVALYLHGDRGLVVHLGDSRLYVIRGGRMLQITDDHLSSSDMFRLGILSQAQAEVHKSASRLTAYVGMDDIYDKKDEAFSKYFIFYPGDIFILCTDGVTDAILNERLEKVTRLLKDATPDQIANTLMDASSEYSDEDRTIVVLRIEQVGQELAPQPSQNVPQKAAFSEEVPLTPSVPVQHALNGPAPAQPQAPAQQQTAYYQPQTSAPAYQPQAPVQPQAPAQQPVYQQPVYNQTPAYQPQAPVQPQTDPYAESFRGASVQAPIPADPEEDEEDEGGFQLPAFLDDLLASPKKLFMVIGIAAAVLLVLIIMIIVISAAGKKKAQQAESSAALESSSAISSVVIDPGSVTPAYESSVTEESSEENSQSGKVTKEYIYVIEEGDNLYDIVEENYGTGSMAYVEALCKYNNMTLDEDLWVGEELKIPTDETIRELAGVTEEDEESSDEE